MLPAPALPPTSFCQADGSLQSTGLAMLVLQWSFRGFLSPPTIKAILALGCFFTLSPLSSLARWFRHLKSPKSIAFSFTSRLSHLLISSCTLHLHLLVHSLHLVRHFHPSAFAQMTLTPGSLPSGRVSAHLWCGTFKELWLWRVISTRKD